MKDRVQNSFKNTVFSLVSYFILSVMNIILRTFFVKNLDEIFLGVNGLFTDFISILNLADLGIGTAMIYSIYKPISDNNVTLIASLMRFYRKVYNIIGSSVFVLGMISLPFLKLIVKESSNIEDFYIIGTLFIVETSITYFITYKRLILFASQKEYVVSTTDTLANFFASILRIISLSVFKNFVLYLVIGIVVSIIFNIILSNVADKKYPYIKSKKVEPIDAETLSQLKVNTKAMLFHKIGGTLVLHTDNLLISAFLGLGDIGIFSNYKLILNAIKALVMRIFNSITASYGNMAVNDTVQKVYITFKRLLFFNYLVATFCSLCLFSMINPFISLWIGNNFLFDDITVIVIIINFHITIMRNAIDTTKVVVGIYKNDRYVPIFEGVINIVSSIIFIKLFGVKGVFLGTIFSSLSTVVWAAPFFVYKIYFKKSFLEYIRLWVSYNLYSFLIIFSSYYINEFLFKGNLGFMFLVYRFIVCMVVFVCFNLVFLKNDNFKYMLSVFKRVVPYFNRTDE